MTARTTSITLHLSVSRRQGQKLSRAINLKTPGSVTNPYHCGKARSTTHLSMQRIDQEIHSDMYSRMASWRFGYTLLLTHSTSCLLHGASAWVRVLHRFVLQMFMFQHSFKTHAFRRCSASTTAFGRACRSLDKKGNISMCRNIMRNNYRENVTQNHILFKLKGEVRRKMNFTYVLGFVVLRDVVKVFPVRSSSFARKTTPRNRVRSHSGAWRGLKTKWDLKWFLPSPTYLIRYLFI